VGEWLIGKDLEGAVVTKSRYCPVIYLGDWGIPGRKLVIHYYK
jgi:hypothetical protein